MFFKKQTSCSCGGACNENAGSEKISVEISSIKVLGSGCKNCHTLKANVDEALKANVDEALKELGINIQTEYVTDMQKILSYNILSTPALVINEKVVSTGRVLSVKDVMDILK